MHREQSLAVMGNCDHGLRITQIEKDLGEFEPRMNTNSRESGND